MKKFMLMATLSVPLFLHAENLLKNGNAESGNDWTPQAVEITQKDKHSGNAAFSLNKSAVIVSSPLIEIDSSKKYKISGFMKSVDPANLSTACFGLRMYDKNKQMITGSNVDIIAGSETELAANADKGATSIFVKDATNWNKRRQTRSMVVFNAKPELADLPNFEIAGLVERVKKAPDSEVWEIKLKNPLNRAYKAGTMVRQHNYGASLDCCLAYRSVPAQWTEYSAEFSGEAPSGAVRDKFWKNTKFVSVYFLGDAARKNAELLFDDIVLEEIKDETAK